MQQSQGHHAYTQALQHPQPYHHHLPQEYILGPENGHDRAVSPDTELVNRLMS